MSVKAIEAEVYIQSGVEAEVQIGREIIKTVYEEPVLEPLSVTANGTYEPEEGIDGYSDVTVNVPGKIPVLEQLNAIVNGEYFPEEGVDGFDEVLVNVPTAPEKFVASGNFTPTSSGQTKTIDTGRTDWTHMLIVPHVFPYVGLTASGLVRAIMSKHVDLENNVMITAYASSSGSSYTSSSYRLVQEGGECEVSDGVVKFSGEGASVGKWIKDCQYDWWAWTDTPIEPKDQNVVEGEFTATETGMFTIDTGYTGTGYPKIITFHQAMGLDDSNLSDFANQSFMTIAAVKCYPQEPEYAETVNLDSYMLNLAYKYGSGTTTRFTQTTGYILSQNDPTYRISNAIRMPNSRTLKIWAGDSYTGEGGYFMIGVTYKYRIIYTS